jgi:hypothetical protein
MAPEAQILVACVLFKAKLFGLHAIWGDRKGA